MSGEKLTITNVADELNEILSDFREGWDSAEETATKIAELNLRSKEAGLPFQFDISETDLARTEIAPSTSSSY